MQALLAVLMIPLIALNFAGGIAGGIWLIVEGEWQVLLACVAYGVLSPIALGLAVMPGLVFAVPSGALLERGHVVLGAILGLPAIIWTQLIMAGSCLLVVWWVSGQWHVGAPWPYLLCAYAAATAPWTYLAQKEIQSGNDAASMPVFFIQLATVSMLVGTALKGGQMDWLALATWCAPLVMIGLLLQWFEVFASGLAARRSDAAARAYLD